jgi:hypothetical protein
MEQTKRPTSAMFLLCISLIALIVSFAGYSLSDVHNTFDILAPVIGILQFILILGLFKGKLWGLIGYTAICVGVLVTIIIYSISKGEAKQWIVPAGFLALLLLLAVDFWTKKRSYFK